jgi:hypothetical protein
LIDTPETERPPLAVAKTDAAVRGDAMNALLAAEWVRALSVSIEDVKAAEANEDDFDACITAAALLRCVLEDVRLCQAPLNSAQAEGGMLGTSAINLRLPEQIFRAGHRGEHKPRAPRISGTKCIEALGATRTFSCPIEGCEKVYEATRGGWDGHVGSARIHPRWHPELTSAEARKRQFKIEFPGFFG